MREKSNRNSTIAVIIATLVLLALIVGALRASSQEVRYLVLIDDGNLRDISSRTYDNLDKVSSSFRYYTGHQLDTTKLFTAKSVYFQYRTGSMSSRRIFYCEKKKVHIKRNGKRVLRRIKRKEVRYYNKKK
jgi:hypothetical protein